MASKTSKKRIVLDNDVVPFLALTLSPILITTWINLDPINLPRLVLISSLATLAIYLIAREILNRRSVALPKARLTFMGIALFFTLAILNAWFFSGTDLTKQFYGQFGRNNGVLAYLGLIILLVSASFARKANRGPWLMFAVSIGGIANLVYGYIQFFGLDPIEWRNAYGPIVGTLGNPNFMSSYLALFGIYVASRLVFAQTFFEPKKTFLALLLAAVLFLIFQTGSVQGIFVLLAGAIVLLVVKTGLIRKNRITLVMFLISGTAAVVLFRGFLGEGALGRYLYQSTFEVRTFFWSAATRMLSANPFHGFGLDSFGDWYRKYRSEDATQFSGDINADSSHSVALDFAAWGGFPLLLSWISLILFVLWHSIRFIRSNSDLDSDFAFIFSAWLGFVLQSFISINQLTLATYGFTFTGLLLSRVIKSSEESSNLKLFKGGRPSVAIFAVLVGFTLALPPVLSDARFRSALLEQEGSRLIAASKAWPRNDSYMLYTAEILSRNGFEEEAVSLSREAIKVNPQNIRAWRIIYLSPKTTEEEKKIAGEKIKYLDPWLRQGVIIEE